MVKFGGEIGTLYQMLKNAFKKYPPQNRTNVQIKGGGVKGLLNNVQKNCTFLKGRHPLYTLYYVKRRSQLRGPFGDEGIDIIGPHVAKTFRLHPFFPVSEAKSCSVRKCGPFISRWQQ